MRGGTRTRTSSEGLRRLSGGWGAPGRDPTATHTRKHRVGAGHARAPSVNSHDPRGLHPAAVPPHSGSPSNRHACRRQGLPGTPTPLWSRGQPPPKRALWLRGSRNTGPGRGRLACSRQQNPEKTNLLPGLCLRHPQDRGLWGPSREQMPRSCPASGTGGVLPRELLGARLQPLWPGTPSTWPRGPGTKSRPGTPSGQALHTQMCRAGGSRCGRGVPLQAAGTLGRQLCWHRRREGLGLLPQAALSPVPARPLGPGPLVHLPSLHPRFQGTQPLRPLFGTE